MPKPKEPIRVMTLGLRESLFAQVKKHLQVGVNPEREFTNDEAQAFLEKHPKILGSIIHFDEVDTTDREAIWEAQRAAEAPNRSIQNP